MAFLVAIYVHDRRGARRGGQAWWRSVGDGADSSATVIHSTTKLTWLSTATQVIPGWGRFPDSILGMSATHQTPYTHEFGPGHPGRTVARTTPASLALNRSAVRWQLSSGRWQRPRRGVVVAHSGPLTDEEKLWAAILAAGRDAVLAGLTAACLDGLTGFGSPAIHLVIPAARRVRTDLPGVVVHRSRVLGADDVHPARRPPRTRLTRSLLDAAAWSGSDNQARALLAAGVQQRLVRADQLMVALGRFPTLRRHALVVATLADIAGGAQALSELDFARLTRRFGLPAPDRQVMRCDGDGRRRWLDAYWEEARLVVEVDGLWHMEVTAWWADMRRDNDLTISGLRVLRFPAFAVRDQPGVVAAQIRSALDGGCVAGP